MTRKNGQKSGFNRDNDGDRSGGGNGHNTRGTGGVRGGGRGGRGNRGYHHDGREYDDRRRGETSGGSNDNTSRTPTLRIMEIKEAQQDKTLTNFRSSELTYNGSDRLVFITNGRSIKNVWKKFLKKVIPFDQDEVRLFVSSALVATDGYDAEEFVTELASSKCGLKRLRDIINYPSMSCDAGLDQNVLSFQYVILPLFGLLTRTAITESILEKYVHAIYMIVYNNLNVMNMLETLVLRNSVVDNQVNVEQLLEHEEYSYIPSSLGIFFLIIVRLLAEVLNRVREASINKTMHQIVYDLQRLKTTYQQSIQREPSSTISTDPLINNLETRNYFFIVLDKEMKNLSKLLNNGRNSLMGEQGPNKDELHLMHCNELARQAAAERSYDPPGELSNDGKRHDNDFEEISKISIIPTKEEILCKRTPFLPYSLPDAPHFLPDGAAKLLDTQFRLLREDMLNPIRNGISSFINALSQDWNSSKELCKILKEGGRFRYNNGTNDKGDLQIYSQVKFANITFDRRKGFSCTLRFTPPKIRNAKNEKDRKLFWEKSKRLLTGSLITLLLPNSESNEISTSDTGSDSYSIYFGVVLLRDEKILAKHAKFADIDIHFIDPSIYPIALNEISNINNGLNKTLRQRFMVETTGVYFEAYNYILKTLQSTNPSSLPFEKYLAPNSDNLADRKGKNKEGSNDVKVEPPLYSRAPGFEFDLSVLCANYDQTPNMKLNVADSSSHDEVAKNLSRHSKLDETQADALVSALTREIALIEGPPGTGKTVVGVEIMKVLLAEENRKARIGPILTICFTNHALDQFLEHLLDENITNIVRLGSRTKSEKIKGFSLEEVCKNHIRNGKQSYFISKLHRSLEEIEQKATEVRNILHKRWLKWADVQEYLMTEYKPFYNKLRRVRDDDLPNWVLETNDDFRLVQNRRKRNLTVFEKWRNGEDIEAINKRKAILSKSQKKKKKRNNYNRYDALRENEESGRNISVDDGQTDYETIQWINNYKEPNTNRPLSVLLNDYSIWNMSRTERKRLHDHWRTQIHHEFIVNLSNLQRRHDEKRKEMCDIYDEGSRRALLSSDVIGMTTNGAAKFQNLIRSIGPRIIICEEAGEVLEAHILSALTPSTQHIILIGDPNQLRPKLATYSLSMDSLLGKNYQLDKSLFERLVRGDKAVKLEKAQLLTQRRMRKEEISDLIRYTLYRNGENTAVYRNLIDGENTSEYPNIRGAQHNVYFIDHRRPEDDSDGEFAMQSHANTYEVQMVVEMVKYFVRNGYTKSDDIAVLTPYLGQMIKIRDALAESFVVIIDERDEQNLAEMDEQQVTLRTVDNFQGEEANIVIVSLVRNFSESGDDSIGFLKSPNRSNVLLSRARQGMYLIGNSELMSSKSDMWARVIKILRNRNQVGFGMPIVCNQHSYYEQIVEPEDFAKYSPDGGCSKPCGSMLSCGHACAYKCHSDDPEHIGIKCQKPCSKILGCNHPCQNLCFEDCGKCKFSIGDMILHCGHELKNAKCWESHSLFKDKIKCLVQIEKQLVCCEHSEVVHCFESVDNVKCSKKCGKFLECGHACVNKCFECQKLSAPQDKPEDEEQTEGIIPIERTKHGKCRQLCKRVLFCGHTCGQPCHDGTLCSPCNNKCTVLCEHTSCNVKCLEPCSVCAEKCSWECEHQGNCELSCGAPCYRLPCNEKCNKKLKCGHKCVGVCGDICPSKDYCAICAPENIKSQVPDLIENTTFGEIDWDKERMIILSCGHVYTMTTMDNYMEMENYYEVSKEIWISVKNLPTSPINIKTCPECRAPIKNIRRYGRIIKKCTLDIQNKKFLIKYDRQLKEITQQIISIEERMIYKRDQLKFDLISLPNVDSRPRGVVLKEYRVISDELPNITPFQYFENVKKYHGFEENSEKVWIIHVGKLLKYYKKLTFILCATQRPPHKKAYEAAVSSLYRTKLAKKIAKKDLTVGLSNLKVQDPQNTETLILQETFSQIGISIPQVDNRIYLDTLFEMINIQKIQFHEVLFIIQEISKKQINLTLENSVNIKDVWKKFAERLQTSIQDQLITFKGIAESTHYGRHLLLVNVEILEFDLKMIMYQLRYPPNESGVVDKALRTKIIENCERIKESIADILKSEGYNNAEETLKSGIHVRLENLSNKCDEVVICAENLSKTLSIEEKLDVHRAMNTEFQSSGHWYECPNGHPVKCGRAMETSRCPDCNAEIGGASHQLTDGNRVNVEFNYM
ncbi:3194_t:CDS:10 [Funneliformis mosseae]|uniref:3194_t:CDS:1 n=1 Tax=Funneliformis mosseae TaxID=27381 RepID=A0A9N9C5X6_FUNMO|nr:3194_t:CDS:10 [Funneliformis mosseae]